ncbi:hypothetical protein [Mycolicibacterium aubagnense]|uniref:PE family protein n=1 Tax=Mycolicibacterium aubagnense TaxID=319707 RepID=A0ABM7IM13_9MYCO|nr:hypothetical protein [Mycolicibacterium aubagnense]TLH64933.1 hypothetical protein C1S80_11565 [Mycolicibacterium aubagnense]WGI30875.1 hypothetical protein QDT91_16480 [Mycolicibacterium aubagnense]BBX87769.1 hypothetical protein MAUB_56420 [Mycolicibacterium aubagnense]
MSVEVRALTAVPVPAQSIAALCTACLVLAAASPPGHARNQSVPVLAPPSISLTAQPLPLPLDLLNQQVVFNVGLFADWVATGAALFQRQTQVPGAFVTDLSAGVPPQTAVARALSAFADIEVEAGRDLIGFAQDFANFQLQFRATTLSAFPPFNAGPGQQFVVATTAFGLNLVQGIADFALAMVTGAQQFTHGLLGTPLPVAPLKTGAVAATSIPVITPKTLLGQKQSAVNTFSPTTTSVGKPTGQRPLTAVINTVTDPPKGLGVQTHSFQTHQPDGNTPQGKTHQSSNKGPHHH